MTDFKNIMKQAQQMQSEFMKMQSQIQDIDVNGSSGGGMVNITMNGKHEITKLNIDPSIIDPNDHEVLSDLIIAAFSDAKSKLDAKMSEQMSALTGGLPAGFKLPF